MNFDQFTNFCSTSESLNNANSATTSKTHSSGPNHINLGVSKLYRMNISVGFEGVTKNLCHRIGCTSKTASKQL
jgi:hypothetical protein